MPAPNKRTKKFEKAHGGNILKKKISQRKVRSRVTKQNTERDLKALATENRLKEQEAQDEEEKKELEAKEEFADLKDLDESDSDEDEDEDMSGDEKEKLKEKDKLQKLINQWAEGNDADRVAGLLLIRRLFIAKPSMRDAILRKMYTTFIRVSSVVNTHTAAGIGFMINGISEIFGEDTDAGHRRAFNSIKQLAVHLKAALTQKDESHRVYNWQVVNALRLWTKVICTHATKGDVSDLIYPLVQIIHGISRLMPTPRFFPLRFHCIGLLNDIAAATGSHVPVAADLLEVLAHPSLHKKPQGKNPVYDFRLNIKAAASTISTKLYIDTCINTALTLLAESVATFSTSIAFPEVSIPISNSLNKFKRTIKSPVFRKKAANFAEAIEQCVKILRKKRAAVNFAPSDTIKVEKFANEMAEKGVTMVSDLAEKWRKEEEEARNPDLEREIQKTRAAEAEESDDGSDEGDMDMVAESDDDESGSDGAEAEDAVKDLEWSDSDDE